MLLPMDNLTFFKLEIHLSYDFTVIQWITSCHKNCITTRVITLWCVQVTALTTSVSAMEIMFILKAIKFDIKGPYKNRFLSLR